MSLERGFIITFICGIAGGLAGTGIGYFVAACLPSYYRTVFQIKPDTNLIELGMGIGLLQGLGGGLAIGLVLSVAQAWYQSRRDAVLRSLESEQKI